jgi:hypothetical protein
MDITLLKQEHVLHVAQLLIAKVAMNHQNIVLLVVITIILKQTEYAMPAQQYTIVHNVEIIAFIAQNVSQITIPIIQEYVKLAVI